MSGRGATAWILLFAVLVGAAFGRDLLAGAPGGGSSGPRTVPVVRVVDGDTIRVRVGGVEEPVRYIGIDTPETKHGVECFGAAAAARNRALVDGRRVTLRFDAERRDRYGRLLAYVHRGGTFVNAALVRGGYARTLTIPPNSRHAAHLARLEDRARARGAGLWRRCRT